MKSLKINETPIERSDSNSLNESNPSLQIVPTDVASSVNHPEPFYEMQAEHFGAEKVRKLSYIKNVYFLC